jgi:hypothetical protein
VLGITKQQEEQITSASPPPPPHATNLPKPPNWNLRIWKLGTGKWKWKHCWLLGLGAGGWGLGKPALPAAGALPVVLLCAVCCRASWETGKICNMSYVAFLMANGQWTSKYELSC